MTLLETSCYATYSPRSNFAAGFAGARVGLVEGLSSVLELPLTSSLFRQLSCLILIDRLEFYLEK